MNFNRIILFPQLFLDPFFSSYPSNFISSLFFKHISSRVCASHICKVTQTGAIPIKIVTLPFLMTVNCQLPIIEVWGFILTSPLHFVCSELLELKCLLRKFVKVYHILAILKCTVQWYWENSFYCAIIASRHLQYSLHFVKLKIHNHLTVNPSFSLVVPHNNHSIVCLCGLEFSKYLNKNEFIVYFFLSGCFRAWSLGFSCVVPSSISSPLVCLFSLHDPFLHFLLHYFYFPWSEIYSICISESSLCYLIL